MSTDATLSTGATATRLGVSRQTVRRLIDDGELTAEWTRPRSEWTRDVNGKVMRGHRKITAESIAAYERRVADAERERQRQPVG